jgi:hypothetical protein
MEKGSGLMSQVIEESVESQSLTQHNLANCWCSITPLKSLTKVLSYLEKDDIVNLSVHLHHLSKAYVIPDGFFKAAFIEYFKLNVVGLDEPE